MSNHGEVELHNWYLAGRYWEAQSDLSPAIWVPHVSGETPRIHFFAALAAKSSPSHFHYWRVNAMISNLAKQSKRYQDMVVGTSLMYLTYSVHLRSGFWGVAKSSSVACLKICPRVKHHQHQARTGHYDQSLTWSTESAPDRERESAIIYILYIRIYIIHVFNGIWYTAWCCIEAQIQIGPSPCDVGDSLWNTWMNQGP